MLPEENVNKDVSKEANKDVSKDVSKKIPKRTILMRCLITCGGVAVVAAAAVIAFQLGASGQPEPVLAVHDYGGRGTVVTPETADEILEQLARPVNDSHYRTVMNVDWVFPSSSEPSTNAFVRNHEENTRTVFFDLTLADTGELIYSSPFIPVGAHIENFTLDADLPAGEYTGIVTYHLVDDNHQPITTVSVSVTLRILA